MAFFKRRNKKKKDKNTYNNRAESVIEYNFEQTETRVYRTRLQEYYVWYKGISDYIINFYNKNEAVNFYSSGLDFRNTRNYFWVVAAKEPDVKKSHSGLPKTMVKLLSTLVNIPQIKIIKSKTDESEELDIIAEDRLNEILDYIDFFTKFKKEYLPLTLALGDGAFFPVVNQKISDLPTVVFYDSRNIDFEYENGILVAITADRYLTEENKSYVLRERRSTIKKDNGQRVATIEYEIFQLRDAQSDEVLFKVNLYDVKEVADAKLVEYQEFPQFDRILAVPIIYDWDDESERGTSLFAGKIDLFDDLDQSLSQRSNSVRLSTPIEYIDSDVLDFNEFNEPIKPKRYDRRYLVSKSDKNSVGENQKKIDTSQPLLNFSEYSAEALETTMNILSGIISPATLGLDLARNSTDLAQREKEKITRETVNDIVDISAKCLKDLFKLLLQFSDYMSNQDNWVNNNYEIIVDYPEFNSPSFDDRLNALSVPYGSNMISPELLVNEVWGNSLSKEEKEKEVMRLEKRNSMPGYGINPFGIEGD